MAHSFWAEHALLIQVVASLLITIVGYFAIRTLKGIDRNQSELFKRLHTLETDFYCLRGEHNAMHQTMYKRRKDDDNE